MKTSPTGRLPTFAEYQEIEARRRAGPARRDEPPSRFEANFADLELRLLSHGLPNMRNLINGGLDLHRARAAEFYGVAYDAVTPEQRDVGKMLNMMDLYR